MKAAVISQGSTSSKWTVDAMKKYFDVVDHININKVEVTIETGKLEVLSEGQKIGHYDCIYPKGSYKYRSLLRSITAALSNETYLPFRSESFLLGHDKLLTQIELQANKIPMPKAYVASSEDQARQILDKINYPIIMKFPHGTQGKGVMYAESYAVAASLLDALTTLKQPFIIQEYIDTGGTDVRAIVVGKKVVAAVRRRAIPGETRANLHMGSEGEPIVLDNVSRNIAIKAAKVIGAEICAVDMLESVRGSSVIEVNLSPGLQGVTKTTNIDVADEIASYLYDETSRRDQGSRKHGARQIMEDLDIEPSKFKEVITNADFRGNRILLPESVTKISKMKEDDEIILDAEKGKIIVRKSDVGQ